MGHPVLFRRVSGVFRRRNFEGAVAGVEARDGIEAGERDEIAAPVLVETEGLAGSEVAAQVLAGFVAVGLGDIAVARGVVVGWAGVEDGIGAVTGVPDATEVVAVARALIVVARAALGVRDESRAGLDGRVEPAAENWVRLDGLRVVRDDLLRPAELVGSAGARWVGWGGLSRRDECPVELRVGRDD
jgi:hypothetical protein